MSQKLNPFSGVPFLDANGDPYSGAKLFVYQAGSSTKQTTTKDLAGASSHENPIILNSAGIIADNAGAAQAMWQPEGQAVKLVLAPSNDTDPPGSAIRTYDNVAGVNDTSVTLSEWVAGQTPTYVSGTSFTVAGDHTSTYQPGRRFRAIVTAGTVYGTILTSAYTTLTTVIVRVDSGSLDSGLSQLDLGLSTLTNPSEPSNPKKPYITITPSSDADVTLTASQYNFERLVLADGSWTSGHSIILPADVARFYLIDNTSGTYDATIKVSGGSDTLTVPAGASRPVVTNGSEVADPNTYAKDIKNQTAETSIDTDDEVLVYDTSASANRKATVANLIAAAPASTGASLVLVASSTPSGVSTLQQSISGYNHIIIDIVKITPVTAGANLTLRMSIDNGSSWETSYNVSSGKFDSSSGTAGAYVASGAANVNLAQSVDNSASVGGLYGKVEIWGAAEGSTQTHVTYHLCFRDGSGNQITYTGSGRVNTADTINEIELAFSSGNISDGQLYWYGVKT